MSHTCGRKQLRDLAEYLRGGLDDKTILTSIGRVQWYEAHLERALKLVEHIAECMEPGPDDPEPEQD